MLGYILYCRLKSKRFPNKGLLKINGKSLIRIFLERISLSSMVDKIVFVTSNLEEDRPLVELAKNEGLETYCGCPEDVLLRLYKTATLFEFPYFITTSFDSPFQLPEYIDAIGEKLIGDNYDMVSLYPGTPIGTECFGLKLDAVKTVIDIKKNENTECWAPYFNDIELFKSKKVSLFDKFSYLNDYRFCLDYPEDYEFSKKLYSELISKYGIGYRFENLIEILNSPVYKKFLKKHRELTEKANRHYENCVADVYQDIENIKSQLINMK